MFPVSDPSFDEVVYLLFLMFPSLFDAFLEQLGLLFDFGGGLLGGARKRGALFAGLSSKMKTQRLERFYLFAGQL